MQYSPSQVKLENSLYVDWIYINSKRYGNWGKCKKSGLVEKMCILCLNALQKLKTISPFTPYLTYID